MADEKKVVIRYTKEEMIKLHDSPLVQKPENMPSLLSWFGEDPDAPATKSILNGSLTTRASSTATDKNIVLGPTKTNFASSTYGGLKRLDDSNITTSSTSKLQQSTSARHHRQLEDRSNTLKDYSRTSRGLIYTGDKGSSYSHRTSSDLNKSLSDRKYMGSSPPHGNYSSSSSMNKNRYNNSGNERLNNGMAGGKQLNYNNRTNNRHHSNHMMGHNNSHNNMGMDRDSDRSERTPEWMDYTPDIDKEAAAKDNEVDEDDVKAKFANDLEAWKSTMKKRDGINDDVAPISAATANKGTSSAAPSTAETAVVLKALETKTVEDSLAGLTFDTPSVVTPTTDPLSFFEDSLLTEPPLRNNQKGGSRFAKFFAKREEPLNSATTAVVEAPDQTLARHLGQLKQPQPSAEQQPRSISLNDLFSAGSPKASLAGASEAGDQAKPDTPLSPPASSMEEKIPDQPVRVFSEEDILKSLGANKSSAPTQTSDLSKSPEIGNTEDAIGFSRVLQILSQPKPSLSSQQQQQDSKKQQPKSNKGSPHSTASPIMHRSDKQSDAKPAISTSTTTNTTSVASKFGSNLPTAVLRQMSARSSEGRSPSLHSSKTNTPVLSDMRYSPSTKHQQQLSQQQPQQHHLQQQQQPLLPHQQHLPNGMPLPPQYFPYHPPHHPPQQQQPYSPGQHHSQMMAFEQMMHFGNAAPGNNGDMQPRGMPPPPPHHPAAASGAPPPPPGSHRHPPHPPHHLPADQQQRFLPHHMMMGPPPPHHPAHMPPPGPGQRPLMGPPLAAFNQQLPPQLQGRFPPPPHLQSQQQQQQQQNDLMLPMPPHPMPNGMPPQMFGKNQ